MGPDCTEGCLYVSLTTGDEIRRAKLSPYVSATTPTGQLNERRDMAQR